MSIRILLSVIFVELFLIQSALKVNSENWTNDVHKNRTVNEPNGIRFQRILHRKKRFLIFPPGSAIVVSFCTIRIEKFRVKLFFQLFYFLIQTTISYTKTLIPKSPSGINMIAECDVFYPLQTQIADWYSVEKPPLPPAPPQPPPPEEFQSPIEPQPITIPNQNFNSRPPPPPPSPFNSNGDRPFLPTDQEIGIKPETVISDPNFNTGSHPGEIYVNEKEKSGNKNRKLPARRYYTQHSKYYGNPFSYYQHSPLHPQPLNVNRNPNTYTSDEMVKNSKFDANNGKLSWKNANIYSKNSNKIHSRGARERRDIFDQFESLMSL